MVASSAGVPSARAADARPAAVSPKAADSARGELQELRQRIEALQKKVAGAEELKSEAADALRESERAISVIGTSTTRPMVSKSVSGLNASLRYSDGAVDMPMWCRSTV
jgi:hypothetical protein